jgi:23S rRNA (guanosine2251-2'-O)-methyltransferase
MEKNSKPSGENYIAGRNSVAELLRSGRPVDRIVVERSKREGSISVLLAKAAERGIPIKEAAREKLDAMCPNTNHQGIVAVAAMTEYCTVEDILDTARSRGEKPFVIVCDGIEDPHNLGAIIRTAECCGAHGVIIGKNRCCGVNFAVSKAACGALEYIKIARVVNIVSAIDTLKDAGVWVYAADMDGVDYKKQDFSGAAALVIGSEGRGVSRLVRDKCDVIVSLPMRGKITSLNASVAAGVMMYEIAAYR